MWDSFSPETAFGLQHRRHGSCLTWRPGISGRRSSGTECITAQCHLRAISVFILATFENFSVSVTTARITLITVSWSYYYYYSVLRAICCQPVDGSLICFM